ncbi:MAG: prolyl aminopeptidase [Paracoccaceae bacterium]|nr:prolyl aminopeptidase [Paracoccaceae bacterium]
MRENFFKPTMPINDILYPPIEPYRQNIVDVGDGHKIYIEECGNPNGSPVLVLHGGPGGGCNPNMRRYFDPSFYRIILFDQRGCGKSKPHASVEKNTTWNLILDIEVIRINLGIEKFILFGGSWGAALSLIYAEQFPDNVTGIILRGVFTMTKCELDWVYTRHGAAKFLPEAWRNFESIIPVSERTDLLTAYHRRLFGSSPSEQAKYARAWTVWENSLASFKSFGNSYNPSIEYAKAFARIENHYFINRGFLKNDEQIIHDLKFIREIPTIIIQGRFDMICPPETAEKVHSSLSNSKLIIVHDAGHAMSEPGISSELINATKTFKKLKR